MSSYVALEEGQAPTPQQAPSAASSARRRLGLAAGAFVVVVGATIAIVAGVTGGTKAAPGNANTKEMAPSVAAGFNIVSGAALAGVVLQGAATEDSSGRRRASDAHGRVDVMGNAVPDACTIDNTEHQDSEATASLQTSTSALQQSMSTNVGLGFSFGFFSASAKVASIRKSTFTSATRRYHATAARRFQIQKVSCDHTTAGLSVTPAFAAAVAALPATYAGLAPNSSGTTPAYIGFLQQWGSHYVTSVAYGGAMTADVSVQSSIVGTSQGQQNADTVTAEVAFSFSKLIGALGGGGSSSSSSSGSGSASWGDKFSSDQLHKYQQSSSSSSVHITGGDATVSQWQQWQQTIRARPGVISTELAPIVNLVTDSAKAAGLQSALKDWLTVCPSSPIDATTPCSGRGTCVWDTRSCSCDEGFSGHACELRDCPANADTGATCSGAGMCNQQTGVCTCDAGRLGDDCSQIQCPIGTNALVCSGNGQCDHTDGSCTCSMDWKSSDCSMACGPITSNKPMYKMTDGTYLPADHCGGSSSSNCGQGPANDWCAWKYGAGTTATDFATSSDDTTTWRSTSQDTCVPFWPHECHPFDYVTCDVSCT